VLQMGSLGYDASASGGMFFFGPTGTGLATFHTPGREHDTLDTLEHEGFHQFAHNYVGDTMPRWLHEGMAEYFEQGVLVRGRFETGMAERQNIEAVQAAVENDYAFEIYDLINITGQQWHANMASGSPLGHLQYAQSWSIVYFLAHADNGRHRKRLETYLTELGKGKQPERAFKVAFSGANPLQLHQAWLDFIDEIEPDAFTEGIEAMHFLAQGYLSLLEANEPMPINIGELRQTLIDRSFTIERRVSHSNTPEVRAATSDRFYLYTDAGGRQHPFELQATRPNNRNAGPLPPSISAPRLKPRPTLEWSHDEYGNPTYEIISR